MLVYGGLSYEIIENVTRKTIVFKNTTGGKMCTIFLGLCVILAIIASIVEKKECYIDDPWDINDVSPWFKTKVYAIMGVVILGILELIFLSIWGIGTAVFAESAVLVSRWFLFFGR